MLVMGSDGLWDNLSTKQILEEVDSMTATFCLPTTVYGYVSGLQNLCEQRWPAAAPLLCIFKTPNCTSC